MSDKDYDAGYLKNTEAFLMDFKKATYTPFANISNGKLLELGCGNGDDAIRLAQLKLKNISVVGVDHDPKLIEGAKQKKEALKIDNVDFEVSEILDLKNLNFSPVVGIRSERLFQHLLKENECMQVMYDLMEPGAVFLAAETDWMGVNIYSEKSETCNSFVEYLVESKVNNGWASREILSMMLNVGLKDVKIDVRPFVIDNLATANVLIKLEETIGEAKEKRFIKEQQMVELIEDLKMLDGKGLFRLQMNMLIFKGIK